MSLADQLAKVSTIPFDQLNYVAAKDVMKTVNSITTEATISAEVSKLSPEQQDVLMKCIYVGLGNDSKSSSIYFKWHSELYSQGGVGCIMRTMTDKASAS